MKTVCRMILPLLAALLLTGCESRPISQQLVVAAMGVDTSTSPWQAKLEIMQEEDNGFYSVSGNSFAEISAKAERRYGYPLYWGAMECVLLSGVEDREDMKSILMALNREPQVGANTQIGLCGDAPELLSQERKGSDFSALLTGQYSRSNDYSLVTVLDALLGDDSGILLPVIGSAEDTLQITGFVPSHTADYSAQWSGNTLLGLITGRHDEQTIEVSPNGNTADIRLQDYCESGVRFTANESAIVTVMLTATVLDAEEKQLSRMEIKNELEKELLHQLEEIRIIVVQQGNTDLFHSAWYARWQGRSDLPDAGDLRFQIDLNLQDPKELLRE